MRTLIVDDDLTSRQLLKEILSKYGKCYLAATGGEAIETFRQAVRTGLYFDLVCMDILMPEMDGFTAVQEIRTVETKDVPADACAKILMTTASNDLKNVLRSVREFCDGYLVKPIDTAQLVDRLKSLELLA